MVINRARILAEGQTIEDARDVVLLEGEPGYLQEGAERYFLIGDGVSTVGQLIDDGHYFVRSSDLPTP